MNRTTRLEDCQACVDSQNIQKGPICVGINFNSEWMTSELEDLETTLFVPKWPYDVVYWVLTMDKIKRWGVEVDICSLLCGNEEESMANLFMLLGGCTCYWPRFLRHIWWEKNKKKHHDEKYEYRTLFHKVYYNIKESKIFSLPPGLKLKIWWAKTSYI